MKSRSVFLIICICVLIVFSSCSGNEKGSEVNSTDPVQKTDFYEDFKSGKALAITPDEYEVMKDGKIIGLPDDAIGVLSTYVCDVDKNGEDEMVTVSIGENKTDGINLGKLQIGLSEFSQDKGFTVNKTSFEDSNTIINDSVYTDYSVFYSDGYIGIYNHYASNFGMGSVYGFNLKIIKVSSSSLKLEKDILYSYAPHHCSLTDETVGKTYFSDADNSTPEFQKSFVEMNNSLPGEFAKLISFNEADFSINDVEDLTALCEISMGKTDYSTYYSEKFTDKTGLLEKIK